jgi:hypothetical protein
VLIESRGVINGILILATNTGPSRESRREVNTVRANKKELPLMLEAGRASIRGADWGGMRVAVVSVPLGTDFTPLLQGLPNDRCQGEHWGYVLQGRLRIQGSDGEEVLSAGDFYHLSPDHTGLAEEDSEFIEIGPPAPHQEFLEAARANIRRMQAAAPAS